MTWWRHLHQKFSGRIRQRVTRLGLIYTVLTLSVGLAAFLSANNLLFLIFAALLSTLLISGFVSRLGLAGLEIDVELPEHLSAKIPATGRVKVKNDKPWMPSFSIHLEGSAESGFSRKLFFPVIPGNGSVNELVSLTFPRRGQYREDSFILSTRFPFGFTERRVRVAIERDIVVYPSVLPQPGFEQILADLEGEISVHRQGRGDEFHRIRPYEFNENVRHVDWKKTARTGELQVREFVREEQPTVEIVLDLDVPESEKTWLEKSIECCAYLSWSLHERNAPFRFRSQLCDLEYSRSSDVYAILRVLALAQPSGFSAPLELNENNRMCVVFSLRSSRPVATEGRNSGNT